MTLTLPLSPGQSVLLFDIPNSQKALPYIEWTKVGHLVAPSRGPSLAFGSKSIPPPYGSHSDDWRQLLHFPIFTCNFPLTLLFPYTACSAPHWGVVLLRPGSRNMEHIGCSSEIECHEWRLRVACEYHMAITIGRQLTVTYKNFKWLVFLTASARFILTTWD